MRQGQSLVMTPQLLQAIKLLQFSSQELTAYVEEELERNPLLERADDRAEPESPAGDAAAALSETKTPDDSGPEAEAADADWDNPGDERSEADWAREDMPTDAAGLAADLGTEVDNAFDLEPPTSRSEATAENSLISDGLSATSWNSPSGGGDEGDDLGVERFSAARPNLRDHLLEQLAIGCVDPVDLMLGRAIIDAINESGYLQEPVDEIAGRLGAETARVEAVLRRIQGFDPSGVGARDLAECLAIQLRERDRFDPAMQALVQNLPLLAKRDFAELKKICRVDDEDIRDMFAEIKRLNPKPGNAFGHEPLQTIVADVIVRAAPDGSWRVELNSESLPRLLVNQTYVALVQRGGAAPGDKSFMTNCLQNANWLTKSLEQRARTILKVASEIVRRQDAFFAHGVEHLRPLNLRAVADVIGMHESTVSRVTSNKYLSCPRGLFELKYFFTAGLPTRSGVEAHSAEAVRYRIKQMIDSENPGDVLSDDAIVAKLKQSDIVIARRTVAKYRESLRIPSSVERRREKATALTG